MKFKLIFNFETQLDISWYFHFLAKMMENDKDLAFKKFLIDKKITKKNKFNKVFLRYWTFIRVLILIFLIPLKNKTIRMNKSINFPINWFKAQDSMTSFLIEQTR